MNIELAEVIKTYSVEDIKGKKFKAVRTYNAKTESIDWNIFETKKGKDDLVGPMVSRKIVERIEDYRKKYMINGKKIRKRRTKEEEK